MTKLLHMLLRVHNDQTDALDLTQIANKIDGRNSNWQSILGKNIRVNVLDIWAANQ